jgi:squalene-hopene/tetraprenyl-beta-curcumene cyclase
MDEDMSLATSPRLASPARAAHRPDGAPGVLDQAVAQARQCLLALQRPDGHWCAELQGDTILESEYVMLMAFLGREHEERVVKAGRYIASQQRPDGAWSNYPGGPVDLSVSVKAYFALKIAGHAAEAAYMRRAKGLILERGGAAGCNSFSKFYLAFLGQFPYENCASVPPEMIFLPTWAYVNLYAMSSWTRTIVIPLSIFSAHKPVRRLPADKGIAELFVEAPGKRLWPHPPSKRLFTWHNFFLAVDQLVKLFEVAGPRSVRRRAVARASAWMRAHFADSDGVGAIFPPIIYTIIALRCLGYADDSAEMLYALKQLDDLMIEEDDTLRVQPCHSPVWDTALAVNSLAMAANVAGTLLVPPYDGSRGNGDGTRHQGDGTRSVPATNGARSAPAANGARTAPAASPLAAAARWLVEHEVRRPGDWSVMNPDLEPGGWYFEYRNGFYPDVDDTAMVIMGLARSGHAFEKSHAFEKGCGDGPAPREYAVKLGAYLGPDQPMTPPLIPAVARGLRWLLAMQNRDGGWAAFDRDINRELLTKVPFADHNAMLDPSCPDITARVLEALGQFGYRPGHQPVARALDFIARAQDRRGCWIGRWGVNYIYGTWQVLQGLEAVGFDPEHALVRRAVQWLQDVQQPSGGWGESCRSYDDPSTAGRGPVTASQTGWALLALIAAGEAETTSVRRGIEWLLDHQQTDGNWHEDEFTGTGFPKVFYLKYHNYRLYFPLMALARYRAAVGAVDLPRVNYTWTPRAAAV